MAAPKITASQQRKIETLIQQWAGKLTWDVLVMRVDLEFGIKTTRQTLCTYLGIYNAFKSRKEMLRGATPEIHAKITRCDVKLVEKVENLQAKIVVLERNNSEQLRFIERILSNAKDIPNVDLNQLIRPRPEEISNG